ncbi:hypothetical protein [Streptomyces sp. NPDC059649]|uniref:NACHT N-terminal Helical domain 1-containing protein n=1 Tax=Streptomyces sp. NPDC059649 TaxID=3346895 RepID=UPI00369E3F53
MPPAARRRRERERPVRVSGWLSHRGEKKSLNEQDLLKLAAELVRRVHVRTSLTPPPGWPVVSRSGGAWRRWPRGLR